MKQPNAKVNLSSIDPLYSEDSGGARPGVGSTIKNSGENSIIIVNSCEQEENRVHIENTMIQ